MRNERTEKKIVKSKLFVDGYVDNHWCIDNKISTRLAAIIHILKAEGVVFDEEKSGYLAGTKNWRYYRKGGAEGTKTQVITQLPNGSVRISYVWNK